MEENKSDKDGNTKLIYLDDVEYTKEPEFPYPNPLCHKDLDEFYSSTLFQHVFDFFQEMIVGSEVFKREGLKLESGSISRFFVRDWKTTYDLLFESFNRIQGTDEFLFLELYGNTGDNKFDFKKFAPKIYRIYCFRMGLSDDPERELEGAKKALESVDEGAWAAWKITKAEKLYEIFDYKLLDPQQESIVMIIEHSEQVKRVALAYSYEEETFTPYPAELCILNNLQKCEKPITSGLSLFEDIDDCSASIIGREKLLSLISGDQVYNKIFTLIDHSYFKSNLRIDKFSMQQCLVGCSLKRFRDYVSIIVEVVHPSDIAIHQVNVILVKKNQIEFNIKIINEHIFDPKRITDDSNFITNKIMPNEAEINILINKLSNFYDVNVCDTKLIAYLNNDNLIYSEFLIVEVCFLRASEEKMLKGLLYFANDSLLKKKTPILFYTPDIDNIDLVEEYLEISPNKYFYTPNNSVSETEITYFLSKKFPNIQRKDLLASQFKTLNNKKYLYALFMYKETICEVCFNLTDKNKNPSLRSYTFYPCNVYHTFSPSFTSLYNIFENFLNTKKEKIFSIKEYELGEDSCFEDIFIINYQNNAGDSFNEVFSKVNNSFQPLRKPEKYFSI